jgi:hypothetical protein
MERLTNSKLSLPAAGAAANHPYGVAEGDAEGDGEVLLFLVVSFFVVPALSFLVVSVVVDFLVVPALSFLVVSVVDDFIDFLVEDFLVVEVFAGAFSGAVVVVDVSVLLVQAVISPAANMTVME